jgi:hypothetical protein
MIILQVGLIHLRKNAKILLRRLTRFLVVPPAPVDLKSLLSSAGKGKVEGVPDLGTGVGVLSLSLLKGTFDFLLLRVCRLNALNIPSSSSELRSNCSIS